MTKKVELTLDQIKLIAGGTTDESASLAVYLAAYGHGTFFNYNPERGDFIDDEAMVKYFASKGYKFVPAFGDQKQNIFYGPDGLPYGNDYMIYLIENGQL